MISNLFIVLGLIALICIVGFIVWNIKTQRLKLLNKLYIALASCYGIWILALLIMKFVEGTDTPTLFVLDAVTNTTGPFTRRYISVYLWLFCMTGIKCREKHGFYLYFQRSAPDCLDKPSAPPSVSGVFRCEDEVVLGPFAWVSGTYHYICLVASFCTDD